MQPSLEEESEGEDGTTKEGRRSPTPPSCRGVSIEVPTTNAASIRGNQLHQPLQETPVAALRRYLETMPQHPSVKVEIKSGAVWRTIRSELVASFLLTVVSSAASIRPLASGLNHPRMLSSSGDGFYIGNGNESQDSMGFGWGAEWAIGHGLTLGALTWAIRTAHFSLPTTLALVVSRKISVLRGVLHTLAQIFGALAATPVLFGLLPRPPRAPSLTPSMSAAQGWGAEFLATILVSLISLSSYESTSTIARLNSHTHHPHVEESFSPKIAHGALLPLVAAHTSAAFFSAGLTGVGLNPARSLALAVVTGCWTNHWIWWVGPALGGILAAFIHEYTGARDPSTAIATLGATPRPSLVPVPRDASRRSFLSSPPASPMY